MEFTTYFEKMMLTNEETIKGSSITDWKDIPNELLLRILTLVDDRTKIVASHVCTSWRDAVAAGLTALSLSWCKNNMNSLVVSLAPKLTKLETLILRQDKPQLEDGSVETAASFCHDITELDLSRSLKLSDRSLYSLSRGCRNLLRLNISGCASFSDAALVNLTAVCTKLRVLNLCGCVQAVSDRALQAIGRNCKELESLNLGWCEKITDLGVMCLAYGCPNLKTLDLCGCVRITDDSVIAVANGCPGLRSLGLYYCRSITDRAMYSLVRYLMKEEEGLRSLNISQCTALTPNAVQALCDSFPALHTCFGRHSLVMSGCSSLTSVHCACVLHSRRAGSAH